MSKTICCIFNIGPHYRAPIYKLMDEELECDFYFGDRITSSIKIMDYHILKGYKKTVRNIPIPKTGFTWQKGVWRLVFKPYKHYIITGSPGFLSSWLLILVARLLGKKVHAWTHGMKGNNTRFGTLIEKKFYHLCHTLLLYGNFSKKIMLKEGFSENKLIPIYNSLDYVKQVEVRQGLSMSNIYIDHFKNENPVIVYIGRIQKSKKLDLLVEALLKLKNQNIMCNLCIIGPNIDNDNDIAELVEKLRLNKQVWFYGPSYDEKEIANLLFNSEVCVSPGLIGLTAIHALTYGIPVITSNLFANHGPEFEAIIEGKTGDFFKNGDVDDLCDKICSWINLNKVNRDRVRQMAFQTIDDKYTPFYQLNVLKKTTRI